MSSIALLIALGATTGLIGQAPATCASGTCGGYAAPAYAYNYSSFYQTPAPTYAAPAPTYAAPAPTCAAPTHAAPAPAYSYGASYGCAGSACNRR